MTALAVAMIAAGGLLIWAGITNVELWPTIIGVFGGADAG